MSDRSFRIALGQMEVSQGKVAENMQKIARLAEQAKAAGASMLCLPELCCPGYFLSAETTCALAEPIDGPLIAALSALAKQHGLFLLAGYAELVGDQENKTIYNSCILLDDTGAVLGNSRKVYLWGKEKEKFSPGDSYPVFETRLGKIAILNCYDCEYPEPSRIVALKGAELIVVPAAWSLGALRRWELELPANALFNLLFVAGVNQVNPYCCGRSQVIGPDGVIRAMADPREAELLCCEIDLAEIAAAREKIPYFQDFRPDTFSMQALEQY